MTADDLYNELYEFKASAPLMVTTRPNIIKNLVLNWQIMLASEDLLELAIEKLDVQTDFDRQLYDYLAHHAEEEVDHAAWVADDLAEGDGVDVATMEVNETVMAMVGTQFYMINYVHPVSLLGYMACLEWFPMDPEVLDELEYQHGTELFRTMRYHAEHDLDHGADLTRIIDQVPEELMDAVVQAAISCAKYQTMLIRNLIEEKKELYDQ
jgi:hypothetical protein